MAWSSPSISARRGPQRELNKRWQPWCMHPWCRNGEILGFGPLNPPKSFAGAISMPCGAHVSLHVTRRVVTPKNNTGTGRIARRKRLAPLMAFRFPRASGFRTSALNENPSGLKDPTPSWLGPLQVSAFGVAHSSNWRMGRNLGACTRGFEISNFLKILTLVRGSAF